MFFHCHEMRLHCFSLSVAWFQLALISSHCFDSFLWLDRLPRSFAGGSSIEKALNLRLLAKSHHHPRWRSGYVRSGQSECTGFKSCSEPSFLPSSFFFSFFVLTVLSCLLICFAGFFLLNIYLNNCY